jgi:hypothetical protein
LANWTVQITANAPANTTTKRLIQNAAPMATFLVWWNQTKANRYPTIARRINSASIMRLHPIVLAGRNPHGDQSLEHGLREAAEGESDGKDVTNHLGSQ